MMLFRRHERKHPLSLFLLTVFTKATNSVTAFVPNYHVARLPFSHHHIPPYQKLRQSKNYSTGAHFRGVACFSSQRKCNPNDDNAPLSRDMLQDLRVPELKDRLRALGLRVGGRKGDLIDRILANKEVQEQAILPISQPPTLQSEDGLISIYDRIPNDGSSVTILACKS
mmetsp:Transcript_23676/g.34508  ORF Transcript_23676/g.34508 Transcript_23676/m.34508 type:complete len:169 (+) Transcript_23676:22-528(+)